jgi:hypothetical protein
LTLILEYSDTYCNVCASDRVTSVRHPALGDRIVSDKFTKSIFCATKTGFSTISFTGPAKIKGAYTDNWLASQLVKLPRDWQPSITFGLKFSPKLRSVDHMRSAIVGSLRDLVTREPYAIPSDLEVIFSGQTFWRKWLVNEILTVKYRRSGRTFLFHRIDPLASFRGNFRILHASGGWHIAEPTIWSQLCRSVLSTPVGQSETIELLMVDAIRAYSARHISVGPDVTTISTLPYEFKTTVRYHSTNRSKGDLGSIADMIGVDNVIYSPWIVKPTMITPPLQLGGSGFSLVIWRHEGRPHTLTVENPDASGNGMILGGYSR